MIDQVIISALGLACFGLALGWATSFRRWEKIENRWRAREEALRDQLWVKTGGTKPVVKFEHEKIIKVPDPEARPEPQNWQEAAFRNDEVLEELEQIHPEIVGMAPEQAARLYPQEWKKIARRLEEERTPLRAN